MDWYVTLIIITIVVVILVTVLVLIQPGLWLRAMISGTWVSFWSMFRMRIKRLDSRMLVNCYIKASKSGVKITLSQIETHAQARGNVNTVIEALVAAHNAGIDLSAETAMAIDLAVVI